MRFPKFFGASSQPFHDHEQDSDVLLGNIARVILFNDNIHTFDDVIVQLCKATGCPEGEASERANEVHSRGKAMVFEGDLPDCLRVTSVLEEIALHTQIEY